MTSNNHKIYQPIHPDVRHLLDPEYVDFHDKYFQYVMPDDQKVWDGSARTRSTIVPATEGNPVEVGDIRDLDLGSYKVRVFTPDTPKPLGGWPVFLWFHGGGWAVGDVGMNKDLCTVVCQRAKCVVVTVGYRLAPEHPFPAAYEDAVHALEWVHGQEGINHLGINRSSIAIGGTSAGGQLAASLAMEAMTMQPPIKIAFQMLVVPVIDNTATISTIWAANKHAPWLTPARMTWYRRMYFVDEANARHWRASPNLAPKSLLAKSPKTWIAVAEQDLLAPEAEEFGRLLTKAWKDFGVAADVDIKEYAGSTHSILAMSGVLTKGRDLVEDAANQVAYWFR